ncbi:MAG: hypothetical protein ACR2GH_03835 [Pseudonocardia sp.]
MDPDLQYLRAARTAAEAAAVDGNKLGSEELAQLAIVAAVRELAAEVRALRHQLTGHNPAVG